MSTQIGPIAGVNLLICNRTPAHWRATEVAIESLRTSDAAGAHLVIVDNGSTEHPGWFRRTGYEVLNTGQNLGIAAGRNVGTRKLLRDQHVEIVVEIHNDMIFPARWLTPLLHVLSTSPEVGLASSSLLTQRGVLGSPKVPICYDEPVASIRQTVERAATRYRQTRLRPGLQHPVAKRVTMLRQIGLYDERFAGMNYEDTDEVRRAAAAGWKYVVVGASVVWHHYLFSRLDLGLDHQRAYDRNRAQFLASAPDAGEFLRRYDHETLAIYR